MALKLTWLCAFVLAIFILDCQASTRPIVTLTLDDFQTVSKRSAIALHQILEAVRRGDNDFMFGDEHVGESGGRRLSNNYAEYFENIPQIRPLLNLQRRGPQEDRRRYIRCYFNVVSCF